MTVPSSKRPVGHRSLLLHHLTTWKLVLPLGLFLAFQFWNLAVLWGTQSESHGALIVPNVNLTTKSLSTSSHGKDNVDRFSLRPLDEPALPKWMVEYLQWHSQEVKSLTSHNWRTKRYLVQRCLASDGICAGLADRLGSLPNTLRIAHDSQRIFLIHWEKPAMLEEFLIPPEKNVDLRLDWRLPPWLKRQMNLTNVKILRTKNALDRIINGTESVVSVRQMHTFDYYRRIVLEEQQRNNGIKTEEPYHTVRALWHAAFQPTPPVTKVIQNTMKELRVTPGQYIATHIRTLYKDDRSTDGRLLMAAVDAANKMLPRPSCPLVVVSDALISTRVAVEYGQVNLRGRTVVGRLGNESAPVEQQTLHLDKGKNFLKSITKDVNKRPTSDFFDIFVDLYILANAQCVAFGVGGFGRLGSQLAHNVDCTSTAYA